MKTFALSGTSAPVPDQRAQAQDVGRHTPRAAANHLSAAEMKKRDAGAVVEDAAALNNVWASRPMKPPGRRA